MTPNEHITDFLEYYFDLKNSPEYAILLKGPWGSGKTKFIKDSLKILETKDIKYLKVSLYGVRSTKEIESAFFAKLHPLLESKVFKIGTDIFKKFFDDKIPNINVLDFISKDDVVLIFDDLERCSMPVNDVIGYINQYVEDKGFKTIIIANENEISDNEGQYKKTKEKLIGKTFEVTSDIESALTVFIENTANADVKKFYNDERSSIHSYYDFSGYKNLRHLKQALEDYERFYSVLSGRVRSENELLKHLLKSYLMYSFELKKGKVSADELHSLMDVSSWFYINTDDEKKELIAIFNKYPDGISHDSILGGQLWVDILDKGMLDGDKINSSLSESKYLLKDDSPLWMKLWDYRALSDETFKEYLIIVDDLFTGKKIENIGEIKHLVGALLTFSELGIYKKNEDEILKDAKIYIDYLEVDNKLPEEIEGEYRKQSYKQHQYLGNKNKFFIDFSQYVNEKVGNQLKVSYKSKSNKLLELLDSNIDEFYEQLVPHTGGIYINVPILSYIKPKEFVEKVINLIPDRLDSLGSTFRERYSYPLKFEDFEIELKWLKSIKRLLNKEKNKRVGELSGYIIDNFVKNYVTKSINHLESRKPSQKAR